MNCCKLSIIVPIYNVQEYLGECLDSIIEGVEKTSKSHDVEIILVNDGSTDGSEIICLDYAKKFDYIKYIYQENRGLSGARNTGIRLSLGEYLLFIDSDDMINSSSLAELVDMSFNDYDLVFLNAMKWFPNDSENKFREFGEYYSKEYIISRKKSEVLKHLTSFIKFPGSAWNKMVKRTFILKNNLFFEEGIYSEDLEWTIRIFNVAEKFGYIDNVYYYYRQGRSDSITGSFGEKNINALFYILDKYKDFNFSEEIKSSQFTFLSYEYLVLLYLLGKVDNMEQKDIAIKRAYKLRKVLYRSHKLLYKAMYVLITVIGIKAASILLVKLKG